LVSGGILKWLERLAKAYSAVSGAWWVILGAQDRNGDENVDGGGQAHEVSDWNKDSVGKWALAIHGTLWQRTCISFVYSLSLHVKLSLKVMD
jgi:hypothetical protein